MKRYIFIICTYIFLSAWSLHAQEHKSVRISGSVHIAGSGEPAVCYVMALDAERQMVKAYTVTDTEGRFSLSVKHEADSLIISLSGMSISTLRKKVPNESAEYDFLVEASEFQIDEVRITADKILLKGEDTISYNVESFRSEEDLVIEDVLKKLPGITVDKSGLIRYNQKPIAGLTIDGMDLLKGRYGIATRNIDPKHIATVEILDNHQVVRALKDLVPSDKTYLNLKLKASSRGIFMLSAAAAGGYDGGALWEAELVPMYFGHTSQHILTAKSNNTGKDLELELRDFSSILADLNPTLTSATLASPPAIAKEKYYSNSSHAASLNDLFRTENGTDITVNLSWLHDTEQRSTLSETQWMLPDSSLNIIGESIDNTISRDIFNAEVGIKSNTSRLYVNSSNLFSAEFRDVLSTVNGVGQAFDLDSYRAMSKAFIVRRSEDGDNALEINTQVAYQHTPYHLHIAPGADTRYAGAVQSISSDGLHASIFMGSITKMKLLGIIIEPVLMANYRLNTLSSSLYLPSSIAQEGYSEAVNSIALHRLRVAPAFTAYYKSLHFDFDLTVPLSYRFTHMDDKLSAKVTDRHRFFVEPTATMKLKPDANTGINLSYTLGYSAPEISTLYESAILVNYRSLSKYIADLTKGMRNTLSLGLEYRDIFHMFFMSFQTSYILGKPNVLYGYSFDGIYSTTLTSRTDELSHSVSANLLLSKGFHWKDLTAKLSLGGYWGNSPYLLQEAVSRIAVQGYSASLDIALSPLRFLGVTYTGDMMWTLPQQSSGENIAPLLTNSNTLNLSFRLPKDIGLSIAGQHYYNCAATPGHRSFILLDASLSYKYRKLRWELTCANLLGTRQYVYSTISPSHSFTTAYNIRPRSFLLKMFISF